MIPDQVVRCTGCNSVVQEYELKPHIKKCKFYPTMALGDLRKLIKDSQASQLKVLLAEIQICQEEVQQLLNPSSSTPSTSVNVSYVRESKIIDPEINIYAYDPHIVSCQRCKHKFYASYDIASLFYVQECCHLFCKACVCKTFDEEFVRNGGKLQCMFTGCKAIIDEKSLKNLLGEKKFEISQNKVIRRLMSIVECAKCKAEYELLPGNPKDAPAKDNNGKALTQQQKKHYAENRFICPESNCKTEQCRECKASPFHTGMTCMNFKQRAEMIKCRYCDEPLTDKNKSKNAVPALRDICNLSQCQALAKGACTKILPCSHPCSGIKGEVDCLPCLKEECCKKNSELNGQSGDDYCNICFIEALNASPCIRSACGHIFHEKCIRKRLQVKWYTPRILFNFCLCPLCKKWISLPQQNPLFSEICKNLELLTKIQTMALERLKFEECDNDLKLKSPESPYYQKPNEYAMAIYAYFMCFKCKNPYFGGRKECADAINEPSDKQFKPQQLVCPNCCDIPIENCKKHGKDFIEFKCKFCCSIAQWFCWGNTHFCDACHKRQCSGDYVSKYTKDKLPKCAGGSKCPSGGNHNGNGEQRSLGCAVCRNFKANGKSY